VYVPIPSIPFSCCGLLKPMRPVSGSGFIEIISAPLAFAFAAQWAFADGWCRGFARVLILLRLRKGHRVWQSLCQCLKDSVRATPLLSWHMLLQSVDCWCRILLQKVGREKRLRWRFCQRCRRGFVGWARLFSSVAIFLKAFSQVMGW
jgi:hypothetical protein